MDSSISRVPNRWVISLEDLVSRQNIECATTPPSLSTIGRLCEERMQLITEIVEEKDECIRSISEQLENLRSTASENDKNCADNNTEIRRLKEIRRQQQAALERTDIKINELYSCKDSMSSEAERIRTELEDLQGKLEIRKLEIEKPKQDELSGRLREIRQRQAKMGEDRKPLKLRELPFIPLEKIMQHATHETLEAFRSTSTKMKNLVETARFTEKEPIILEIRVYDNCIQDIDSQPSCLDLVAGNEEHTPLSEEKTEYPIFQGEDEESSKIICEDGTPLREVLGKRRVKVIMNVEEGSWSPEVQELIVEALKTCQVDHLSVGWDNAFEPDEMWVALGKPKMEIGSEVYHTRSESLDCVRRLPFVTDLFVYIHLDADPEVEDDLYDLIDEWKDGTREIKKWVLQSSCFRNLEEEVIRRKCDGKVMTIKCTDYDKMTFSVSD